MQYLQYNRDWVTIQYSVNTIQCNTMQCNTYDTTVTEWIQFTRGTKRPSTASPWPRCVWSDGGVKEGSVWPIYKSALALVKLKGFAATALFFPLFAFFLFFTSRETVAVKIKGDKSIGHWTEVPGWSDTVFIPSVNNQEKKNEERCPKTHPNPQQIRSK